MVCELHSVQSYDLRRGYSSIFVHDNGENEN